MVKKNEDLIEKQNRLMKQDGEMYAWISASQEQKWDGVDDRWEELWVKYYQWDRINIRFMNPRVEDVLGVRSKMEIMQEGDWPLGKIDPVLIPFRDAMVNHFPNDALHGVAQDIWMEDEYYKWTFIVKRKFDLIPPFVKPGTPISEDICDLYAETRASYVAGQFRAAVALCRTVIECCIRKKLRKGSRDEFILKDSLNALVNLKLITQETFSIAEDIRLRANKILHYGAPLNEKQALTFINDTKTFIEEFYKK
mgnify:CR=1 FL=1|jgi:hypothetical protein